MSLTYFLFKIRVVNIKVKKMAKIRNRYNQAPHLTQDTNGKVTTSQLDITNKSQEVTTDNWAIFREKYIFIIFCNLPFHFVNNDIKKNKNQCHRLVFELWHFKDMHNKPFFPKMFTDEVRQNRSVVW